MKLGKRRSDYTLPPVKHLELLFRDPHGPSLEAAYELLWLTQYGSKQRRCPQCGLNSNFVTIKRIDMSPLFYCEYLFCRYVEEIQPPFINSQSRLSLITWLHFILTVKRYPGLAMDNVAKQNNVSWATARSMLQKLHKVTDL